MMCTLWGTCPCPGGGRDVQSLGHNLGIDGSVAFVEERDGWGHVKAPGLRVISSDGKERFLPSVTGDATSTFAAFQAERAAHEAVIRDANTFLDNGHFRPLFPLTEVQTDAGVSKTRKFAAAGVVVSFNYPSAEKEGAFQELVIVQDGKEVARKKGTAFPDQKGCSARALKVEGARPESKVFAFSFVNGATLHNCDGKAEPQVHHVVRW